MNEKMWDPLFIHYKLIDVIQHAKSECQLEPDDSIKFMFIECISYFKKSGMSIEDVIKKCSINYTLADTSLPTIG